jgi:hypothetical protein
MNRGVFQIVALPCFLWSVETPTTAGDPGWCTPPTSDNLKCTHEQYVPSALASSIIAHTKTVSGGESDEVEFTIPQAGIYDFICSYPGHWGTMQGKIVAE